MSMDKYQRYRAKCINEGRCPHCGKPCAPYRTCEARRERKRFLYLLRRMVAAGLLETNGRRGCELACRAADGLAELPFREYAKGREDDRRYLPRINGKPINLQEIVVEALKQLGRLATVEEIEEAAMAVIAELRQPQ